MKILIKNLGSISEGTVELESQLTILTGPNNTGKSYLTYLIHGISQYGDLSDNKELQEKVVQILNASELTKQISKSGGEIPIATIMQEAVPNLAHLLIAITQENLPKIFASRAIKAEIELGEFAHQVTTVDSSITDIRVTGNRIDMILGDKSIRDNVMPENLINRIGLHNALIQTCYFLGRVTLDVISKKRTYFFPAERTAINLFAKHITSTKAEIKDELDSEVITGMSDEELGRRLRAQVKAAPKYTYAIRDYINFVNSFQPGEEGQFAAIANKIEASLVGGKVHLDKFDQLVFTPTDSSDPLELHQSSSLVKSLSYLVLYLRYVAQEGDQVIIDEPELNLHPNLQLAIAKTIAEMVNAGLKVIISTHSDYLVKELNNLILLSKLEVSDENTKFFSDLGYGREHFLSTDQISAYFLDNGKIKSIDIEQDGLVVPSINEAITKVDSLAEEVFFRLEE